MASYGTVPATAPPVGVRRTRVSPMSDILLYFIALFIPPIPVFLKTGCGVDLLINILLWILGWIPGVIHAWWIISRSEGAM
ncbi:hypothetical protein JAAARDRAFT_32678 [Jaapia argillacea MUCL 33604]|uniref:Uncharacterized protein n=1 Tax=Jaapia argillacea MUCL 33604 TaxID=933084 RepID=A0A067Q9V1_9AGAM|nr:hypothetical protein JAAARDRAFT_32678 [Jaapia argillacea MUCL 33604]